MTHQEQITLLREALEFYVDMMELEGWHPTQAYEALAATAAPAEQPKPVAWRLELEGGKYSVFHADHERVLRNERNVISPLYAAPTEQTERNFCPRCGKRNGVHTCTPPAKESA